MSNMMMSRRKKKIKVPEYHAKSDSDSSSFEEFSANLNYKYNQKPVAIENSNLATEKVKNPDIKAVSSSIVRSIVR